MMYTYYIRVLKNAVDPKFEYNYVGAWMARKLLIYRGHGFDKDTPI